MKRLLLSFTMLFSMSFCFAQATYGTYTKFPDKGLGTSYNPQLAFGKINDQYLLVLLYIDPTDYALFNEESVILLKFDDDSVAKLPISKLDDVTKDLETEWINIAKRYFYYYKTYTSYDIEQDVIDKIVKEKLNIKKIRVSFTNGDIKDWDINVKYKPKFIKGLVESYNVVVAEDADRKEKLKNVEDNF